MVKAKREMKKKKMTIAEYRRQKLMERLPEARAKTLLEQEKERQKMEGAKALRELEKEKEKIGSEKAKRIGTISELRDLYPELSDSDFMRFVKSQFGFDVPAETRAMARESGEDKGFTQSVLSSLSKIRKAETLKAKIEKENLTGRKRLQVLDAVKKLELRQREEKAQEEKRINEAKEREKAKQLMEAKEAEAFAQELVGKKKKKKKVQGEPQGEPQGEGEGEGEAPPPKKTLVITKKKLKSEQPEVKLEQEEATALREKLVEQEAQQAQQADTEALLNMPDIAPELSQEEGLGLIKRYAIHPSRFTKDKGGILSLNKKGVKHLNNVAKILHPKHLKNVVEFSVLNKIRNDFIARKIKRQMQRQRQKAKGGELESDNSVSGGGFFGSILDGIF
jgi:hypothetical protein